MSSAKVYSYIRFSDVRQAGGASSERQRAYAVKWAADHGLQLDEALSMRDEGLSAYHQRHVKKGALGLFLRAIEEGRVAPGSVLIVEGLDRLSRADPIDAQAQLTSIINAGISVVTAEDSKVYSRANLKANPFDLIHSLLKMIRANEESETKSRRVRDAIRRQCQGWVAGTYRGLIRYGNTPGWLKAVGQRWELVPERAEAIRSAIDMFLRGMGTGQIAKALHDAGLAIGDGPVSSGHLLRLLGQPALFGDKHIELEGETFRLVGYYPPVISREVWDQVQLLGQSRTRKHVKGDIPSVLTGFGVTHCGYCGSPMKAQTMANKRRADGTLADGHRRLQCVKVNHGDGCPVPGSCSAAPIERTIMAWCSDLVNLQALYDGDRAAVPRATLATSTARLAELDVKLERLTDALLESDQAPAAFTKRARELEAERGRIVDEIKAAEGALAAASRADLAGADERWRALVEGVDRLDYEARIKARQLVADTFERIVVYRAGQEPASAPRGVIDLVLVAKGGKARLLRIAKTGELVGAEEVTA